MEKLTQEKIAALTTFIEESGLRAEELRRAQAILLLSEGTSALLIKTLTGLKKSTAVKIRKKYIKHGIDILRSKRKDKKPRALLTRTDRAEIAMILNSKIPRDFGWEYDHWTPSILASFILQFYGVKYKSKSSLCLIFKEAKITYHKPEKTYKKRDQKAIDAWIKEVQPTIEAAWQDQNTVILVADEMILTSQTTLQKIWLPEGKFEKIECSNVRKRRSIYGFLDLKSGQEHAFKAERQINEVTAKILKKVLSFYKDKKVILLWDNAPWHFGKYMRAFLDTCTNLHIINFPPYAPDENPQEHVWKAGRTHVTHNKFIKDIDTAVRQFIVYLNNATFKYQFLGFTAQ